MKNLLTAAALAAHVTALLALPVSVTGAIVTTTAVAQPAADADRLSHLPPTRLRVRFGYPEQVRGVNVVITDGDTVVINGTKIRLLGIDTPETFRSRCEKELVLGLAAKARLRSLLDTGAVTYKPEGTDRYGRVLAEVFAGSANVGETLVEEGHALPYRPGRAAKLERLRAWCGPNAELSDTWRAGS